MLAAGHRAALALLKLPARLTLLRCFSIAVAHTQTASGKAAHKLDAETEDFHRE